MKHRKEETSKMETKKDQRTRERKKKVQETKEVSFGEKNACGGEFMRQWSVTDGFKS